MRIFAESYLIYPPLSTLAWREINPYPIVPEIFANCKKIRSTNYALPDHSRRKSRFGHGGSIGARHIFGRVGLTQWKPCAAKRAILPLTKQNSSEISSHLKYF